MFAAFATISSLAAGEARLLYLIAAGNDLGERDEPALRYAEKDATQFFTTMQQLGGVPSHQASLVLGQDAEGLQRVLFDANAAIRASASQRDSVLIVYFSGHADAQGVHLGDTTLPFDTLKTIVAGSPASVRILILDACRSGGATQVKGAKATSEFPVQIEDRLSTEGVAIITSSTAGEDSYESEQIQGSFFSHHLVNGLRGAADANRDERVTLAEAYDYAFRQTLRSSGRTRDLQHPTFQFDLKGTGDLALTTFIGDARRAGRLGLRSKGLYLVHQGDEHGLLVAEVAVGDRGAQLLLPQGSYFVQRREQRHYLEYEATLAAGERLELDHLPATRVEYARLLRKGGDEDGVVWSVHALAGAHPSPLVDDVVVPEVTFGVGADLEALGLALRCRLSREHLGAREATPSQRNEFGCGALGERPFDLGPVTLGMALEVAAELHRQHYETSGIAPPRTSLGFSLAALLRVDWPLAAGASLLVEVGPRAVVLRRADVAAGAAVDTHVAASVTWAARTGLGWRF